MWPIPRDNNERQKVLNSIEQKKIFISRYAPGYDIEALCDKPITELERVYRNLLSQIKEEKKQRNKSESKKGVMGYNA